MIKKFLILILILSNTLFGNSDSIIAPKKYKPAEMNIEVTKINIKEIEGDFNFSTGEILIKKNNIEKVEKEDFLFINYDLKNFTKLNFKSNPKENNDFYFFPFNKNHKDKIYLIHSDKTNIKNIYSIKIIPEEDLYTKILLLIPKHNNEILFQGYPDNGYLQFISGLGFAKIIKFSKDDFPTKGIFVDGISNNSSYQFKLSDNNKTISIIHNSGTIVATFKITNNFNDLFYLEGEISKNLGNNTFKIYYENNDNTYKIPGIIEMRGFTEGDDSLEYLLENIDFGTLNIDSQGNVQGEAFGSIAFYNTNKTIFIDYVNKDINLSNGTNLLKVTLETPIKENNFFKLPAKISLQPGAIGEYNGSAYLNILLIDSNQGGKF